MVERIHRAVLADILSVKLQCSWLLRFNASFWGVEPVARPHFEPWKRTVISRTRFKSSFWGLENRDQSDKMSLWIIHSSGASTQLKPQILRLCSQRIGAARVENFSGSFWSTDFFPFSFVRNLWRTDFSSRNSQRVPWKKSQKMVK